MEDIELPYLGKTTNSTELPDTKPMALSLLRSTERNLKKHNGVAEEYKATIQAYV